MARPLLARKKDLAYLVFFVIHVPVMLGMSKCIPISLHHSNCLETDGSSANKLLKKTCSTGPSFCSLVWSCSLRFGQFVSDTPIPTVVDLYPLYPDSIRPKFMHDIRQFYITTYRDQFFVAPP